MKNIEKMRLISEEKYQTLLQNEHNKSDENKTEPLKSENSKETSSENNNPSTEDYEKIEDAEDLKKQNSLSVSGKSENSPEILNNVEEERLSPPPGIRASRKKTIKPKQNWQKLF